MPLAYFSVGSPLAIFSVLFEQGSPLAGQHLLLWYFMVSFFSADSLLSSKVVLSSAARRSTMSWACSLVLQPANLLPRRLHFSMKIPSMGFPSKRSLSMVVVFVLHAIALILLALLFAFVLW